MNYKLFGKSGLRVSEVALGTMTFGTDWGWGADKDESKKILMPIAMQVAISLIPPIAIQKAQVKNLSANLFIRTETISYWRPNIP